MCEVHTPVNLRLVIILVNLAAFATIGIILLWRVFSLRRNPEPKPPQNLTPFLPDEDARGPQARAGARGSRCSRPRSSR